ncbi:hypothetical protein DOY81_005354, partial [Sarcophaga bullata]
MVPCSPCGFVNKCNRPCIPEIYSKDLQEIIAFMLEVENDQRPSIEVISRHPILVRNINELGTDFPVLIDIDASQQEDFCVHSDLRESKLDYKPLCNFSSTMLTEQNSFNEGYGQRRLSITGVFTPDLKDELFYSAKRKIFPLNSKLQLSDPELYESIRRDNYETINDHAVKSSNFNKNETNHFERLLQPDAVTRNVFDDALQERLQAIRAQESLLRQREEELNSREQQLNEKEKRLIAFEQSLVSKCQLYKKETNTKTNSINKPASSNERLRMTLPAEKHSSLPPPIPPRKSVKHDETYCTIEPNDTTLLHQPTVAKLNMASLPAVKTFPGLRKVTFQSPKKFITYEVDHKPSKIVNANRNTPNAMQSSTSSKGSEDSTESSTTGSSSNGSTTKRKSILSIFGLSRNNKETNSSSSTLSSSSSNSGVKTTQVSISSTNTKEPKDQLINQKEERIISKCEANELTNIWTREHKKAAFEMLAAMNAAERSNDGYFSNAPRHKIRQSVRDRNTLQRT